MNKHTIIGVSLVMLIIATLACGESTPVVEEANDTDDAPIATVPTTAGLGETIEQDGCSLSAVAIADPAEPGMLYSAEEGERLIAVEVILANTGKDDLSANVLYATLIDADGFTYTTELAAIDNQLDTVSLAEGERVRGWIGFSIPDDATPARMKYKCSPIVGPTLTVGLD